MTESGRRCNKHSRVNGQGGKTWFSDPLHGALCGRCPRSRLAFTIRTVYDHLPSRDNLQSWSLVEDDKCGTKTLHNGDVALFPGAEAKRPEMMLLPPSMNAIIE